MINYEQEVKKVYPKAYSVYESYSAMFANGYEIINEGVLLAEMCITEDYAWQSVYEKLKKEGKI